MARILSWRFLRLLVNGASTIVACAIVGCVSKPPIVKTSMESVAEPELVVGTPGAVGFPEQKTDTDDEFSDTANDIAGCTRDDQCKVDRVCIAGACVSPKYADEYEARYMASAGISNISSSGEDPVIDVLVPPTIKHVRCKKKNVARCMKRCENGDMDSCYAVGKVYEELPGDAKHARYSLYAYRKACDGGHAASCVILSRMYFVGAVVDRNFSIAFRLNVEGCQQQNLYACANAAIFLENGIGVEKNLDKSIEYHTSACFFGHDASCHKAKGSDE